MRSIHFPCPPLASALQSLLLLSLAICLVLGLVACRGSTEANSELPPESLRLQVITSVAPLTDIVAQVGGEYIGLQGLVPAGVNSHTFEPTPSDAVSLARAQIVFLNGLQLEALILDLIEGSQRQGTEVVLLGDLVLEQSDWIFDFSFPESGGAPNPHLWMDPTLVMAYVEIIAARLSAADAENARAYTSRASSYKDLLKRLDEAIIASVNTIPPEQRRLLTYHDSWAYFAHRYGFTVIGAIQPADMSEPSARELAGFIRQIQEAEVQVVFGAQEFPSPALQAIAKETGAELNDSLADDVLPGEPGSLGHSYVGMMKHNVSIIVEALGGDSTALQDLPSQL